MCCCEKFMFRSKDSFFEMKNNKKGIFALEALLGTVLSALVLFILFSVVSDVFLTTPTNLQIANNDAKSIQGFVNYYSDNSNQYGNLKECFNVLKLSNLENFQVKSEDGIKNYFYVIDSKGINLLKYSDLTSFLEVKDLSKIKVIETFKFNKEVLLKEDRTNPGNWFSVDITDPLVGGVNLASFGRYGNLDIKTNLNPPYILLIPDIGSNNNILKVYSLKEGVCNNNGLQSCFDKKELKGAYIVFGKNVDNKDIVFASENEISDMFIGNNLCSRKLLAQSDLNSYYNSVGIENIDYFNNKFDLVCEWEGPSSTKEIFKVNWFNGASCVFDKDFCEKLNDDYEDLYQTEYKPLVKELRNLCKGTVSGEYKLKIKNIERLQPKDIKVNSVPFENVFIKSDVDVISSTINKEAMNFFDSGWLGGGEMNGCQKEQYCNEMFVDGKGRANFFVKKEELTEKEINERKKEVVNFYSFNQFVLSKKYDKANDKMHFFFLGEEVENKQVKLDLKSNALKKYCSFDSKMACLGALFGGIDDEPYYKLSLKGIDGKERYDIYLTPVQVFGIPSLDRELVTFNDILKEQVIDQSKITNGNFNKEGYGYYEGRAYKKIDEKYYVFDENKLTRGTEDKENYLKVSFNGENLIYIGRSREIQVNSQEIFYEFKLSNVAKDETGESNSETIYLTREQLLKVNGVIIKEDLVDEYFEKGKNG